MCGSRLGALGFILWNPGLSPHTCALSVCPRLPVCAEMSSAAAQQGAMPAGNALNLDLGAMIGSKATGKVGKC